MLTCRSFARLARRTFSGHYKCVTAFRCFSRWQSSRSSACARGDATPAQQPATAATAPPPDLASVHSDTPGIAWFKGDVDAAFKSAQASNKPVLLYWGAQWCPPCKQLKSAVFSRPDFIEKSKLFVAVYLDGDLPDAQKWGDVFRVTGYPTVVVLKPDRTEITRIAGNMDLSLYARVLDDALGDVRPVKDVLALAVKGDAPLNATDCRRLAYHAFDLDDEGVFDTEDAAERVRERGAALPAGPRQGTRALPHPRGGRGGGPAEGGHREGRQGGQTTHRAHRARERTAHQQAAGHGERRRAARTAEGVLPRGAPDAAADRVGPAHARHVRGRRHHGEPAVRAGRPARRAAHEDPRRAGVFTRRQGAHRRAHRRAADRDEDARRQAGALRARRRGEFRDQHLHRARRLGARARPAGARSIDVEHASLLHRRPRRRRGAPGQQAALARAAGRGVPEGARPGVALPVGLPVSRRPAAAGAR